MGMLMEVSNLLFKYRFLACDSGFMLMLSKSREHQNVKSSIKIRFNEVQSSNAKSSMVLTFLKILICSIPEWAKAKALIAVTLLGRVMSLRLAQWKKTPDSIEVRLLPKVTFYNLEQLAKALA